MSVNQLRFSLLGPIRAWFDDREIALGPPQQRALLAVLLLRVGEPVTHEDAVRALWGDVAPKAADGTVRTYVYRLRRKITEAVGTQRLALRSQSGWYLLMATDVSIDTDLFERSLEDARMAGEAGDVRRAVELFRRSLALWHGVPLGGTDTAYFNAERERLEQLRATAVEELAEAEIRAGGHAGAVTTLRTALAANPLQENLWELLLRALCGLGRRADALVAYQDARRVLRAELGLEPGPRLQEAHHEILAGTGVRPVTGGRRTSDQVPTQLPIIADGFVGRTAELAELTARLLGPDRPSLVGLSGAASIGKTAVAVRAAEILRPHFPDGRLYTALTGSDLTAVTPHVLLVSLLRELGVSSARLPQALPELMSLWQRSVAGKRMLIVFDDVPDGFQVQSVLPRSTAPSVLLVSRYRLGDVPGLHSMVLGSLTLADALQLLGALVGHHRLHQDVEAAAGLVAACGYRPCSVRAAAERLLAAPHRSLRELALELPHRSPAADSFTLLGV